MLLAFDISFYLKLGGGDDDDDDDDDDDNDDDDDDDDEFFLRNGCSIKAVQPYLHPGSLSKILINANL